jgi:asparagine synthase (glutamine-hydrolysing)
MCGICGWVELGGESSVADARELISRMQNAIAHRGPDDRGEVIFPGGALAMTRLSVIDLTTGHQPLSNVEETCWIVYNGEVYNFGELRRELESRGHRFRTHSDTEVVLHAYMEWGDTCVEWLRGMFAFAVWDARERALFLARDRVGKKPLFYHEGGGRFAFASEIKALLADEQVPRRVNCRVLPEYLVHGYVPAPETMFEGIRELPPGHTLLLKNGRKQLREYWDGLPAKSPSASASEAELREQLLALLAEAVRLRLVSEVPLGAFLSGGVDSAAVVALMARESGRPVKTFTMGFAGDPSFDELEYARVVAKHYSTEHHEEIVRPSAVELLPGIVRHVEQPFADSSAIPTYLVSRFARQHVTVVLTGDGGDELFAGYERFAAARLAEWYRRSPETLRQGFAALLRRLPESTDYDSTVRRLRRFVEQAPLPLAQRYLGWVGIFDRRFLSELLAEGEWRDPLERYQEWFERVKDRDLTAQLLYVNARTYLPGDLLVKTDRMSMAHSLEARCPLLDHRLYEWAAALPSRWKLRGRTGKYIFKRALRGIVPEKILWRRKHGFGVPVGRWFRHELKDFVRDLLCSDQARVRGYFRPDTVERLIEEHQSGKRDHGHRLWTLLTLELWHHHFLDRKLSS